LSVEIAEHLNTRPFALRSAITQLRADACIRRVARKRRGAREHDKRWPAPSMPDHATRIPRRV
jgi:hypothetical protein